MKHFRIATAAFLLVCAICSQLREDMKANGRHSWGAVEWLWPSSTPEEWETHIRDAISFMDCRVLAIYNWDRGIEKQPAGLQGIRNLLEKQ